ncbi:hypothetical protein O0S10_06145 [Methanocorpusculum sp. MG]|uniref:DUF86 domain-containing protein n=1 Tax=Methanocorpusculum petauri TaxID=3002863 RepID=A0ABT4II95_9EURY|nr:HepT-like ribonuclease domain-containing protein [Methanocorpusculum petauri]MCZ0860808.1 hypothetical protein [Methanocorpusculum petauri]MDE2443301.1 hypothetical protein [Methanocorpusculum sp.]
MKHDISLRSDTIYFQHICDEVNFLLTASKNLTYEVLLQDPILQRAIIRSLEVMGEASRNLSPDGKCTYPEIPW